MQIKTNISIDQSTTPVERNARVRTAAVIMIWKKINSAAKMLWSSVSERQNRVNSENKLFTTPGFTIDEIIARRASKNRSLKNYTQFDDLSFEQFKSSDAAAMEIIGQGKFPKRCRMHRVNNTLSVYHQFKRDENFQFPSPPALATIMEED